MYLGDCREVMPQIGAYEAIVTDPVWPNVPDHADIQGKERPDALFEEFCGLLPRGLRQLVIVLRNDSDPRMLRHVPGFLPFQQVTWLQYVMPGYLGRVLGGNECGYVFGTPVKRVEHRVVIPSVSPKAQPGDRPPNGHPMSRALIHQEWLVNWFSDVGETVLDPFMGSGTTGIACYRHGRRFIGIEIDERYFDIACRRLEADMRQQRLL